ncbi:unnamed protein product [Ilex paraguariensis]|uniref:ARM repeat superfamily protein n=1 Tax=Ilex paraguariensis TaxID=185542 RepID=A0ABC8V1L4_9AQUA
MSIPSELPADEDEEEQVEAQEHQPPPAHHPSAPSDELFDISTTVDPSSVISLIRRLLPPDVRNSSMSYGVDAFDVSMQGSRIERLEGSVTTLTENGVLHSPNNQSELMETVDNSGVLDSSEERNDCLSHQHKHQSGLVGEAAWEEYGCILWDLAASKTHAELMVQNVILEVLLASLMASQSMRVTEIGLGILGNLACHEVSRKQIVSIDGLVETIVDQLFLVDTPCLCEAFRLLTLCLQGSEGITWAEALQTEHILCRILWIAENTLNLQLIEKSVGLLLAILQHQQEVTTVLLPPLMKLGLPSLLINLLALEMSKLTGEREPERYSVLDLILQTIEALNVSDNYSQEICLNMELFRLLNDLIKLPDKIEVADSCVTAAVLIANILIDAADLDLEISQDLSFLQGILDIFPFASDDKEAQSALWSILSRLLVQVQEREMSPSSLHQYVSILVNKSEMIEELLFDQIDDFNEEDEISNTSGAKATARATALNSIFSILSEWTSLEEHVKERFPAGENHLSEGDVDRLLNCCSKYTFK